MAESASVCCTFSDFSIQNGRSKFRILSPAAVGIQQASRNLWLTRGHPSLLLHSGGGVQRSVKVALRSFSQNVVGTFLCRFRFPFGILEGIVNPRKPQCVCVCVYVFVCLCET